MLVLACTNYQKKIHSYMCMKLMWMVYHSELIILLVVLHII